MQIEIYKPVAGDSVQPVEWNYAEVKKWLEDGLALYKGRVYGDNDIAEAKRDAAELRKLAAVIDGKRKEMKKQYLKPYEEFETQAKELTGLINEQVEEIAAQIKAHDEDVKAQKLETIKAMYTEIFGDLVPLVPFKLIQNPKWLNVTYRMGQIEAELTFRANTIRAELRSIDALEADADTMAQVKHVYLETLELARALAAKTRIESERARLAEYEAEQKRKANGDSVAAAEPVPHEALGYAADEEPELLTVDFRVHVTRSQLTALKSFLVSHGIRYGRVPCDR